MLKGTTTKKKLIENYQSTISSMSSENSILKKQISDLEKTINLNQNILFDIILSSSNNNSEEIKTSINSTKNLWKQNLSLLDKNNHIQSELSILQEISEDTPNKIREELILYRTQNEKYKEEINKQKEKIIKLQKNLNNIRRNNYHQDASTEIYVTAPNKKNVECNQEIIKIKKMLDKVIIINKQKEEKTNNMKKELENLIKQVESLKQTIYSIYNNNNNEKDKNDINEFIKKNIIGYNFSVDEIEKEEKINEEKNNNLDDYGDTLSNSETKKLKGQLDKMVEEYNLIKKQCQEYEDIIFANKKKYKNIEGKINEMKKSIFDYDEQ